MDFETVANNLYEELCPYDLMNAGINSFEEFKTELKDNLTDWVYNLTEMLKEYKGE